MARKVIHNACMFCDQFPCACNPVEPKPKKASRKKSNHNPDPLVVAADLADGTRIIQTVSEEATGISPLDAMRMAAVAHADSKPIDELASDPEAVEAIANLRDVLAPEEVDKHDFAFSPEAAKMRAASWKERRAQH